MNMGMGECWPAKERWRRPPPLHEARHLPRSQARASLMPVLPSTSASVAATSRSGGASAPSLDSQVSSGRVFAVPSFPPRQVVSGQWAYPEWGVLTPLPSGCPPDACSGGWQEAVALRLEDRVLLTASAFLRCGR